MSHFHPESGAHRGTPLNNSAERINKGLQYTNFLARRAEVTLGRVNYLIGESSHPVEGNRLMSELLDDAAARQRVMGEVFWAKAARRLGFTEEVTMALWNEKIRMEKEVIGLSRRGMPGAHLIPRETGVEMDGDIDNLLDTAAPVDLTRRRAGPNSSSVTSEGTRPAGQEPAPSVELINDIFSTPLEPFELSEAVIREVNANFEFQGDEMSQFNHFVDTPEYDAIGASQGAGLERSNEGWARTLIADPDVTPDTIERLFQTRFDVTTDTNNEYAGMTMEDSRRLAQPFNNNELTQATETMFSFARSHSDMMWTETLLGEDAIGEEHFAEITSNYFQSEYSE